jgi:DNA-nicking Smr family endonuclease
MTGPRDKPPLPRATPVRSGSHAPQHAPQDGSRRKPRPLISAEDHALWDHAASSIEPLRGVRSRVHRVHEDGDARQGGYANHGRPAPLESVARASRQHTLPGDGKPHPVAHAPAVKPAPPLAKFDRNMGRKLRGGRTEIEARIDLHGMRQSEAHAALRNFLHSCRARGLSTVLVITGKGAPTGRPADDEPFWMGGSDGERGVLKRNVPRWLAEPDLRAIVVSFTTAAIRHGGEGALYIHLRRRFGERSEP